METDQLVRVVLLATRQFADASDSLLKGVNSRYSSQFPAQVTTAATWDVELFASRAEAMAKEFKAAGIHVPLAIVAGGPMGRSVYGGRNWENFSPDPYLTGVAARLTVEGFQKHNVHGHVKVSQRTAVLCRALLILNTLLSSNHVALPRQVSDYHRHCPHVKSF